MAISRRLLLAMSLHAGLMTHTLLATSERAERESADYDMTCHGERLT